METPKSFNFGNGLTLGYFTQKFSSKALFYNDVKDYAWSDAERKIVLEIVDTINQHANEWATDRGNYGITANKLMKLLLGSEISGHKIKLETVVMKGIDFGTSVGTDRKISNTPEEWGDNRCMKSNFHSLCYCSFVFDEKNSLDSKISKSEIRSRSFHLAIEFFKPETYDVHVYMAHTREMLDHILFTRFGVEELYFTTNPDTYWFDVLNGGKKNVQVVKSKEK